MFDSVKVGGRGKAEVIVVGKFAKQDLDDAARALDGDGAIAAAAKRTEGSGEAGKVAEAYPGGKGGPSRVLLVGLGERDKFKPGDLRAVAGAVGRRLAAVKAERVGVELAGAMHAAGADAEEAGRCFGEGLGLIGWNCDQFKGSAAEKPKRLPLAAGSSDRAFEQGMARGVAMAQGANLARTLSETPPNIATPDYMAEQARKLARDTGMSFKVFKGAELERERFAGLVNVGKASENGPCMIRLEYRPKAGRASGGRGGKGKGAGAKPVVLIGKTMTYDTGGLSLKVNNGMLGMKRDKDGGCAVLGAMHAIATVVRPNVPVVALLAAAENSISDEAYRPDDILRFRNGVTVEVTNTDAEGRLVLADALCWACEKENPACVVDVATLTGGVVVALGSTFAGMFCEDDALRARFQGAMDRSGERWWRLPMDKEYRDMMKSPVADILNSNPNRKAHPIQGAAFLSYFVQDRIPWAHIDIAGVHVADGDNGPYVKGPTGYGARLLAEFVAEM